MASLTSKLALNIELCGGCELGVGRCHVHSALRQVFLFWRLGTNSSLQSPSHALTVQISVDIFWGSSSWHVGLGGTFKNQTATPSMRTQMGQYWADRNSSPTLRKWLFFHFSVFFSGEGTVLLCIFNKGTLTNKQSSSSSMPFSFWFLKPVQCTYSKRAPSLVSCQSFTIPFLLHPCFAFSSAVSWTSGQRAPKPHVHHFRSDTASEVYTLFISLDKHFWFIVHIL